MTEGKRLDWVEHTEEHVTPLATLPRRCPLRDTLRDLVGYSQALKSPRTAEYIGENDDFYAALARAEAALRGHGWDGDVMDTDDPVARAVMTSMDNPEECHHRVGEGWNCNQPKGHGGPHGIVYVRGAAGSAGTDPLDELRAAYHDIPTGQPVAEWVLDRLPRLYTAIEAVLTHNPCKELGEAYAELQGRFIRFGEDVSTGADSEPPLRVSERHAAENILNRHDADPDDDAAIVARAALRLGAQVRPSVIDVDLLARALHSMRVPERAHPTTNPCPLCSEMAERIAAEAAGLRSESDR